MKFIVDAQLPQLLATRLNHWGQDCVHTLNLPEGNFTKDSSIREWADTEERVVISKDADFVNSHLLQGSPSKLLLISTGNVSNSSS